MITRKKQLQEQRQRDHYRKNKLSTVLTKLNPGQLGIWPNGGEEKLIVDTIIIKNKLNINKFMVLNPVKIYYVPFVLKMKGSSNVPIVVKECN